MYVTQIASENYRGYNDRTQGDNTFVICHRGRNSKEDQLHNNITTKSVQLQVRAMFY